MFYIYRISFSWIRVEDEIPEVHPIVEKVRKSTHKEAKKLWPVIPPGRKLAKQIYETHQFDPTGTFMQKTSPHSNKMFTRADMCCVINARNKIYIAPRQSIFLKLGSERFGGTPPKVLFATHSPAKQYKVIECGPSPHSSSVLRKRSHPRVCPFRGKR